MTSSNTRVLIIGAGASGLSCALQLSELGCTDVTVLDQDHVAAGSSSLSVGMFTRSYSERLDIELRVWSHEFLGHLQETAGLQLRRNGFLRLARDEAALRLLSEGVDMQRSLGVQDSRILSPNEISRLAPDLVVDDLAGALYLSDDGYLDGAVLCNTYQQVATARGVQVLSRSQVTGVKALSSGFEVLTSRGKYAADVVVNAAGPWSKHVGELLGSPVDLVPQRHEAAVIGLEKPLSYTMPNVMDYVPGSARDGVYFRHESEGQLVAGVHSNDVHAEVPEDPDAFARRVDDSFIEHLGELLEARLHNADQLSVEASWAGLYPMSRDGNPLLGPTHRPGVYACTGMGGVGIYMSPIAGRLVAESIVFGEFAAVEGANSLRADRIAPISAGVVEGP